MYHRVSGNTALEQTYHHNNPEEINCYLRNKEYVDIF